MRIKSLFLLPALIAGLCLVTTGESMAEHLTVLHTFGSIQNDGANPYADLILSGNTLYGTAAGGGGLYGGGTVFKVSTDGGGFTNLLTFTNSYFNQGYTPYSRLVLVDDALYGTTLHGGSGAYDEGTVFKVKAMERASLVSIGLRSAAALLPD